MYHYFGMLLKYRGVSNIMSPCYWHHRSDLNVTLLCRHKLNVTLGYCVTVGAEILLTQPLECQNGTVLILEDTTCFTTVTQSDVGGQQDEKKAGTTPSQAQSGKKYPKTQPPKKQKSCRVPQQNGLITQTSPITERRGLAGRNKKKTPPKLRKGQKQLNEKPPRKAENYRA